MKNTITLKFSDVEDLRRVQRYIEMAKSKDGTVTGLWAGLMCSALKRSETVPTDPAPELLEACKFILSQLHPFAEGEITHQTKLYSDCLAPNSDDQTVTEWLREIISKAEGNA